MALHLMLTAAADARTAVADMLESFAFAVESLGFDYVSELVDIDESTLRRQLDGTEEMTLTQLRHLAIATGTSLRIEAVDTELAH